jgi:DNA invertase Pin-like site-specific DNA recombinase
MAGPIDATPYRPASAVINTKELPMTVSSPETATLRWAAYCRHSTSAASKTGLDKCRCAPAHIPQIKAEPELALFDAGRALKSNLSKLIEMAEAGEIDLLVVPGVSRIARSTLALSRFLNRLKSSGAGLYSIDQGWLVYPKALKDTSRLSRGPMSSLALAVHLGLGSELHH